MGATLPRIGYKRETPIPTTVGVSHSLAAPHLPAGAAFLWVSGAGIISSAYLKDPTDPQWKDYPDMKAWNQFLDKYYPDADRADGAVIYAYMEAQALEHVLKACGDNLTRENVMKQAASIKDLELGDLLPGIKLNTSATDFAPLSHLQLARFKGETWERFGDIVSADVGE